MKALPAADETLAVVRASLEDDKAEDIVVIDLSNKASFADYMVIATGRSDRHVGACADHLVERLKAAGFHDVPAEGMATREWVLLDAGDVIIHLFKPEVREFYKLEKMWSDASGTAAHAAELIA